MSKPEAEISVVLCDDARIRELNQIWRNKNASTDVLSWPLFEEVPEDAEALGDVVISWDTAITQAKARNWSVEEEVALLLVHGILHLLGHEDETLAGSKKMQAIESQILGKPLDKVNAEYKETNAAGTINS